MFANWAPACRVLVDNVSEWFSASWAESTSLAGRVGGCMGKGE